MAVTNVAFQGSEVLPFPLDSERFARGIGIDRSRARACKVLGATRIEPIADEIVDAAKPSGIITAPKTAMSLIIS